MAILNTAAIVLRANRYSGSGNLLDESGNGNDATLVNAPAWDGDKFTMVRASSQALTIADADELDVDSGTFTWVLVLSIPATVDTATHRVLQKRQNAQPWWGFDLALPAGTGTFTMTDLITTRTAAVGGLTAGTGPHVWSLCHNPAVGQRVGLSGVYANSGGTLGDPVTSPTVVGIGRNAAFNQYADIEFYGLAMWKGVYLTDAEVEEAGTALTEAAPDDDSSTGQLLVLGLL